MQGSETTQMKKTWMTVALIASLVGCAVFAYLWIDRSITLSYVNHGADASSAAAHRMEALLANEWRGMPEGVVLEKLQAEAARQPSKSILVKKENGVIWFDDTRFNFEAGRLKSVGGG